MVVLVEVLESSEPIGKHGSNYHATCFEIVTDVQQVEGWVVRKDRAGQRKGSKARDVNSRLENWVPVKTFVSRLSTGGWRQSDRVRLRGREAVLRHRSFRDEGVEVGSEFYRGEADGMVVVELVAQVGEANSVVGAVGGLGRARDDSHFIVDQKIVLLSDSTIETERGTDRRGGIAMKELEGSFDPEWIWHDCFGQRVELACRGDGELGNRGTNRWRRTDMGCPKRWVDIDGGAAVGSRHGRRKGLRKWQEKFR
jgi:hypothetical protein